MLLYDIGEKRTLPQSILQCKTTQFYHIFNSVRRFKTSLSKNSLLLIFNVVLYSKCACWHSSMCHVRHSLTWFDNFTLEDLEWFQMLRKIIIYCAAVIGKSNWMLCFRKLNDTWNWDLFSTTKRRVNALHIAKCLFLIIMMIEYSPCANINIMKFVMNVVKNFN